MLSRESLERALEKYPDITLDEVGAWTELKERIVSYYTQVYANILSRAKVSLKYYWIDAFASAGVHIARDTGEILPGSAYLATTIEPRFNHYYFIDTDPRCISFLMELLGQCSQYGYINADANDALLAQVYPAFGWRSFRRGLCFLDAYGMDLHWDTVVQAGRTGTDNGGKGTIECIINYPQHDIQRNVFRDDPSQISENHSIRMDRFWGDDSWRGILYDQKETLFGDLSDYRHANSKQILLKAYMDRLQKYGGYEFITEPFPLRNNNGADVFFLVFATHSPQAKRAMQQTLSKFRRDDRI